MRVVKAAAVQISPVLYSRDGTVERVVRKIHELGQLGVEFATFPETIVPYYPYFSIVQSGYQIIAGSEFVKLLEQSVTVPSPTTAAIADACRQASIVVSIGVNERDGGTLYNTQLLFDADGTLIQRRRKITPTHYERMIWGQGDGSGLRAVDSKAGRIGQLACWEHYNPLNRYSMIADGEQIHSAMFPGSMFGDLFAAQTQVAMRQHALESGCFVVCATAWLDPEQQAQIVKDTGGPIGPLSGGHFTAIVAPDGTLLAGPIQSGEGTVVADLDFTRIARRKHVMDSRGHYSRPELLSLQIDRSVKSCIHEVTVQTNPFAEETTKVVHQEGFTTTEVPVRRLSVVSSKSFEEVVESLMAEVGRTDMEAFHDALLASKTTEDIENLIQNAVGPSGLMEFVRFDAGEVLRKERQSVEPKILRLLVGNPLIMKRMAKHVPEAAAYAPVTILVDQRTDGVHLSYDSMASLLAPYGDAVALEVARDLDHKIEKLLKNAAGTAGQAARAA